MEDNLNISCRNDVSDDDCKKCFVRGIIFNCPVKCEDYEPCLPIERKRDENKKL